METTIQNSLQLWSLWTGSTWTACPATAWWTSGWSPFSPGGLGSTPLSPCCRSSGGSCCWRRTWSLANHQKVLPINLGEGAIEITVDNSSHSIHISGVSLDFHFHTVSPKLSSLSAITEWKWTCVLQLLLPTTIFELSNGFLRGREGDIQILETMTVMYKKSEELYSDYSYIPCRWRCCKKRSTFLCDIRWLI